MMSPLPPSWAIRMDCLTAKRMKGRSRGLREPKIPSLSRHRRNSAEQYLLTILWVSYLSPKSIPLFSVELVEQTCLHFHSTLKLSAFPWFATHWLRELRGIIGEPLVDMESSARQWPILSSFPAISVENVWQAGFDWDEEQGGAEKADHMVYQLQKPTVSITKYLDRICRLEDLTDQIRPHVLNRRVVYNSRRGVKLAQIEGCSDSASASSILTVTALNYWDINQLKSWLHSRLFTQRWKARNSFEQKT